MKRQERQDRLLGSLIRKITGSVTPSSFGRCKERLLHHRFLDVNRLQVEADIQAIAERFRVQGHDARAHALLEYYARWKEAVALMRENDEEMDAAAVVARQDAPYAVLALLCHLAAAKPPEGSVADATSPIRPRPPELTRKKDEAEELPLPARVELERALTAAASSYDEWLVEFQRDARTGSSSDEEQEESSQDESSEEEETEEEEEEEQPGSIPVGIVPGREGEEEGGGIDQQRQQQQQQEEEGKEIVIAAAAQQQQQPKPIKPWNSLQAMLQQQLAGGLARHGLNLEGFLSPPVLCSEEWLVSNALLALSGLPSDVFMLDEASGQWVASSAYAVTHLSRTALHRLLQEFAKIATDRQTVTSIIQQFGGFDSRSGRCAQAFCDALASWVALKGLTRCSWSLRLISRILTARNQ